MLATALCLGVAWEFLERGYIGMLMNINESSENKLFDIAANLVGALLGSAVNGGKREERDS
jgi:hypothetical protein